MTLNIQFLAHILWHDAFPATFIANIVKGSQKSLIVTSEPWCNALFNLCKIVRMWCILCFLAVHT